MCWDLGTNLEVFLQYCFLKREYSMRPYKEQYKQTRKPKGEVNVKGAFWAKCIVHRKHTIGFDQELWVDAHTIGIFFKQSVMFPRT